MELVFVLLVIVVVLAIPAFIVSCFDQIPVRHRKLDEPWKSWLILIPIIAFYWNFRVFVGLSDSFQSAFAERGDNSVGDCGRQQAMVISVGSILCLIPGINFLAVPAVGFGVIAWLWKMNQLKQRYGSTHSVMPQTISTNYPTYEANSESLLSKVSRAATAAQTEINARAAANRAANPQSSKFGGCGCLLAVLGILIILFVAYSAWKIVDVRREGADYLYQRQYNSRPSWSR